MTAANGRARLEGECMKYQPKPAEKSADEWSSGDLTAAYMAGVERGRDAARDEASELRAAVKEWADAKQAVDDADRAWTDAIDARQGVSGRQAAWTRAMRRERAAELVLRRLAGGENEK